MTVQTQDPRSASGSSSRMGNRPDGNGVRNPAPLGRELTALGILTVFRRRWVPALAVAIPAALLATAAMWELIPAKYQSATILKIEQKERKLVDDGPQRESDFLMYRESQKNYMLSRQVVTAALRDPKVAECPTLKARDFPVEYLLTQLKADDSLSAEFLKVTLEGENPRDLALILNAVKDAFLDQTVYISRNAKIEELKRLEEQYEQTNKLVIAAQENIDRLAESLKIGSGDPKVLSATHGMMQQDLDDDLKEMRMINSLIRQEEAARTSMLQMGVTPGTTALDGLTGTADPRLGGSAVIGQDPGFLLQQQLLALRTQIQKFREQIRDPNHPELTRLKEQEQSLVSMLSGGATSTATSGISKIDFLKLQRDTLEKDIANKQARLSDFSAKLIELDAEKRKIESDIKLRDSLQEGVKQRRIELYAPDRISVVQEANVPEEPAMKKKTQYSLLTGAATFCCIVCGFTMFEWFSYRVGAATDISGEVGLRLIGTIPSPDRGGLLGLGIFAGRVDFDEWNRAVTESMDVVRTFLMRHIDPSRPASILITGASANEGKTTVCCQLAASLARTGKRVALVDCDFRRPSAHELVDGKLGPGLSEYLRGEVTLDEIRQQTQAPGLTFIGAGQVDQRVLQMLAVDGGRNLIQQLKSRYDFVVLDTSPLLFVAEPSMIAQNADIVLLATRKDYSRVQYVMQARDSLRSLQVPLLGAIMVGADSDFQRQTYGYQQEVVRMSLT
jgi:succinoglycan biosynthesis transport protein ExoP